MRILAFCDYYDRASIGGAERVAREVYARLARDPEIQITVVGAVPGHPKSSQRIVRQDGVRVVGVPGRDLSRYLGAQLMVGRGTSRLARGEHARSKPDVIHINGLHFHSSAVGARLARRYDVPVVTTAHLADVAAMPGKLRFATSAFDRIAGRYVLRASDRVLAVSSAVAEHVIDLGAKVSQVSLAYNGVDHMTFHPRDRERRRAGLRVILIGRLIAAKGTMHALDAVARARTHGRDIRLTIVGDGPLGDAVRRRAREADLSGAVEIVGRVTDVEHWLRRSDVALRPSYTEGLPLAVLEALASGVPVICTDVPGNLEAVTHALDGLVVSVGDTEGLANALIRLYDDRDELERLSTGAVKTAARFTWEVTADAHLAAFRSFTSASQEHVHT